MEDMELTIRQICTSFIADMQQALGQTEISIMADKEHGKS